MQKAEARSRWRSDRTAPSRSCSSLRCCCGWCCWADGCCCWADGRSCCCCESCRIRWRVASLFFLFCLSPLPSLSRVSPTQFPLRTCSVACLAARQVLRRPLALRMCGPLSTRTHHAFCHHVMCLFDTWLSSCTEFTSSSCPPWAFALLSCPPWASTSVSCPSWALLLVFVVPHELSFLLVAPPTLSFLTVAPPALSSALAPPALSSLPRAPPARSPPGWASSPLAS